MAATRPFPRESLEQSIVIANKISEENAGAPMKRLLVADVLDISPGSSNFKYLLSSSRSYGLTEGTEKAAEISLTKLGRTVARESGLARKNALIQALLNIELFKKFLTRFNENKFPSLDMTKKILVSDFELDEAKAEEAARLIHENANFTGIIREISGTPRVMLDFDSLDSTSSNEEELNADPAGETEDETTIDDLDQASQKPTESAVATASINKQAPKAIFIGHGRNTGPLEKLEKILAGFQIPFKVAVTEPNLGRPIPQKVRETMLDCGSAILIFTKDQKFVDEGGNEIWRPSENVVHELGAASFAYQDKVMIFKEAGITLPSNFSSVGYIEFEEDAIEAKTMDLLRELIGFGLVKITPTE